MSVLDGPRHERRRILLAGREQWVTTDDGETLHLADGRTLSDDDAVYLAPVNPSKIICGHVTYNSRRIEFGVDNLPNPSYFQKPTTALNGHRGELHIPEGCQYINYEGELAVEIGRPFRGLHPDDVWDVVSGFAPANDVGLQDYRDIDRGSMLRVKGMDGFCPIGPGIVSGVDVRESAVRTYLNGEVVQDAPVSDMIWSIGFLLADLSRYMTFLPGDIVLTGCPANSRPMTVGDVVEVEVTGVGRLSNTVVRVPQARHQEFGHQPTDTNEVRRVALGGDFVRRAE